MLGTSTATLDGREFTGLGIDVGNPHLACVAADLSVAALGDLDLTAPPAFDTAFFPNGVNMEIVTPLTDGAVDMRVYERGVGETRSCGTGTVAAAAAALAQAGADDGEVVVRIPGGEVCVTVAAGAAVVAGSVGARGHRQPGSVLVALSCADGITRCEPASRRGSMDGI